MKQTIECILLIDDDSATNFIHKMHLQRFAQAKQIITAENGLKALDFLQTKENQKYPQPDLILLDINMPVMNGWEFLESYRQLDPAQQAKKLILMMTAALNPDERAKAEANPLISGFMHKPLNAALTRELIQNYFGS